MAEYFVLLSTVIVFWHKSKPVWTLVFPWPSLDEASSNSADMLVDFQGLILLFVSLQCIWVSNPRYKETIHCFPPPSVSFTVLWLQLRTWQVWVQVSIRVLCSSHLNTALFHAGESSVVVAARLGSDSVLCVDGAWVLGIPAALQGFIPCPWSCF